MNNPKDWTRRELDDIFNRHVGHLEAIAREMPHGLHSVDVELDPATQKPVINFLFAKGAEPDLDLLPKEIGGHGVTHRFLR